jgi:dTDP-4-dehydrorhamnose reductase
MKTIWIAGSKGQLGTELSLRKEQYADTRFLLTDIQELDLTDQKAILDFSAKEKPDLMINCAGYTAVDKAEEESGNAFLLNRDVPAYLAEAAGRVKAILVHISTDYVFDGRSFRPYRENDAPNPQSVYGSSKLAGEEAVLKYPENLVVRTSWLYSAHGHNFLKTMLRLGRERDELGVVFDQVGSPTSAADLADALLQISRQLLYGKKNAGGIYHFSNEGVCSWYDFAKAIMELAQLNCVVKPITTDQFPTLARRPHYSVFDKGKIKGSFGIDVPHWRASVVRTLDALLSSM